MFLVSIAVPLQGNALVYMSPSNFSASTYHTVAYDSPQKLISATWWCFFPSNNILYSYRLINFLHLCMSTVHLKFRYHFSIDKSSKWEEQMDLLSDSVFPVTSVHGLNCSTAAQRSWQTRVFLMSVSQFSFLTVPLDYAVKVQQLQRAVFFSGGSF